MLGWVRTAALAMGGSNQSLFLLGAFISDLSGRPDDTYAFVRTIVQLGHTLRLRTVAEGIENEEQRDALRRIGCVAPRGHVGSAERVR